MPHSSVVQSFCHSQSSTTLGQKRQAVQIAKRLITKSANNNEDPHLALLAYRATPLECGKSPAELFFGRELRTTLPNVQHHQNAKLKGRKTKTYYDQSAKPLKSLSTNAPFRLYSNGSWKQKATVLEEVSPCSYNIQTDDGAIYR